MPQSKQDRELNQVQYSNNTPYCSCIKCTKGVVLVQSSEIVINWNLENLVVDYTYCNSGDSSGVQVLIQASETVKLVGTLRFC